MKKVMQKTGEAVTQDQIIQELNVFAAEIAAMLEEGKTLREISQYSYAERERGRGVPYLQIQDKERGGSVTRIVAYAVKSQKVLHAFFTEPAPGSSVFPKYSLYVDTAVHFQEKLGKGKDNRLSLI